MNIIKETIIVDTNILIDASIAGVLEEFVKLDNLLISDLVKETEINSKTGDIVEIEKIKVISSTSEQIYKMNMVTTSEPNLTAEDAINFILAKDNNLVLPTDNKRLRKYAIRNDVKIIGPLKILDLMLENRIITKKKYSQSLIKLHNSNNRLPDEEIIKRIEESYLQK